MERPQISIVKVGGRVVEVAENRQRLIETFAQVKGSKILVHGGGNQASVLSEKMDIPIRMHQGRRITDAATMEVVTMVYAGLINKTLVAEMQACGINALGLSGADLNSILSEKRPVGEVDYGFAGDVKQVNAKAIGALLQADICPVFCAITHDGSGQLLNTNADTIAACLAKTMSGYFNVRLYLCLDKPGVLDKQGALIPLLDQTSYRELKEQLVIRDGMIPKLDNAFSVVEKSSAQVYICNVSNMVKNGGTEILR